MTALNPGDRVQWLGFVRSNMGEPERPVGTLGTVRTNHFGIPEIDWDGGNGTIDGKEYSGSTWADNIAPAPTPEPVDPDTQALRERLLAQAARVADFGAAPESIVEAAQAFEAYITGDTK